MSDILSLTVVQLKEYAKENEISIRGLRLKKDLQDAIIAAEKKKEKKKVKSKTKEKSREKNKYKSDDYIIDDEEDDTEETKHVKKLTKFLYEMYGTTNILKDDPMFDGCGIGRYIYRKWEPSVKKINIKSVLDAFRTIIKKYKLSIPRTTSSAEVSLIFMSLYKDRIESTPEEYKLVVSKLRAMIKK